MPIFFRKKYSLDDLVKITDSISVNRSQLNVAVIDDKDFPYLDILRQHGYQVTKFDDIKSTKQLSEYHIIICDLRGVGKSFGSKYEGGHLIEEISKNLPHKYLIAYSGSVFKTDYNKFFKLCDESVMKGIDVNEMVNLLDRASRDINDPIYQWKKTRTVLEANKVSSEQISKIEKKYVHSLIDRNSKRLDNTIKKHNENPLTNESVKLILNSLAIFSASLITNLSKVS